VRRRVLISLLGVANLLGAGALSADPDEPARPSERLDFGSRRPALLHAPRKPGQPAPLVVFLHGMCALPEYECPVFEPGTRSAWLLCPPGPVACGASGAMWTGDANKLIKAITASSEAASAEHGAAIAAEPRTLIGYSMGATAALRIALKQPGTFQRLMIVNASVSVSAADLRRAQVTRIAFVAGERDRSAGKLKQSAQRLAKAGLDAQFFALAKTGHYFDARSAGLLTVPLTWLVSAKTRP